MNGQMSIDDFFNKKEKKEVYPLWNDYVRLIDGEKVKAYLCNDKEWYVVHGLEHDWYNMEPQRAFESNYRRV